MRLESFLCYAGVEIANDRRTSTYIANQGLPGAIMSRECGCDSYDDGYDMVSTDPAPWHETTRPDSEDFYGFHAHSMTLDSVFSRNVTQSGRMGGVISPLRAKTRQLLVQGNMLARNAAGMQYGSRWLAEVLRGSPCNDWGCPTDDILFLPACPEDGYDDDAAFRTLVNVGLVDGPTFVRIGDLPECNVEQASFILSSSLPWIYHPTTRCLEEAPIAGTLSCSLTTPEWMGDGTFVIDITSVDTGDVQDISIVGRLSPDGSCPVDDPGTSIPPLWRYDIPVLHAKDRIVIDGMRRQALYYDASEKRARSALPYLDFIGPHVWPDAGVCSTVCVTLTVGSGDAVTTVDSVLREL